MFLLFPESDGNSSGREVQRLKKRNLQLEEENNLLKLKIETLLDMVRPASLSMSYKWNMENSNTDITLNAVTYFCS